MTNSKPISLLKKIFGFGIKKIDKRNMNLYELPKFNIPKIDLQKIRFPKIRLPKFFKNPVFWTLILSIFLSSLFGFLAGAISGGYFYSEIQDYFSKLDFAVLQPEKIIEKQIIEKEYIPQTSQEEKIIKAVDKVSPSVVSIIITKDLPVFEEFFGPPPFESLIPQRRQKGTEKKEIGGGTGFIISEDGMILTNKHVVLEKEADYTVLTNDGKKFPAKILAQDPIRDLAVIKIEQEKQVNEKGDYLDKEFPTVDLGDSSKLQTGQTVIAIGNALGEFRNTVSVGVVSGLKRTVTASGPGIVETLENLIQTDAAINEGNSGGPLLNLKGEVIGINVAMAQAENIGFSIPINDAKKDIEQVKTLGKIVYPYLGVYYCIINEKVQEKYKLKVDYGAWIGRNIYCQPHEITTTPDSAAEKAGLQENDIILEFGKEKITIENSLAEIIQKYNPGDKVALKILRKNEEKIIGVILGEKSE